MRYLPLIGDRRKEEQAAGECCNCQLGKRLQGSVHIMNAQAGDVQICNATVGEVKQTWA